MAERKPIVYVSGNPQEIADTDRVKNTGVSYQASQPSNPQNGDAWVNAGSQKLYQVYNGGAWHALSYLTQVDVVNDLSPQLGNPLDVNGNAITSANNGDIVLDPHGTGSIEVGATVTTSSNADIVLDPHGTGSIVVGAPLKTTSNGDIDLDPNGSGDVVIKGNSTRGAGAIQLNCEFNSHGIKLKSPPHSANASYTLTFPNDAGTNGYALTTNGSGVLSWTEQVPNGSITSAKLDTNITIAGNLTVNGTTTTVNSTTLTVDDKNIELGSVSSPSDTTADGGGITLKGASDKTITWVNSTDCWTFNQSVNLTAGTASAPALILNGDVNTGFFQSAADEIAVGTAGSERFRIGPLGQMGLSGANYGTSGQVLTSSGSGAAPTWGDVSASPTFQATATGTLANGDTVVVRSDGNVEAITQNSYTYASASNVVYQTGTTNYFAAIFEPTSGKVVVCYTQQASAPNNLKCTLGSISGETITFTTPVNVTTDTATSPSLATKGDGTFVVSFVDGANADYCGVKVGTISGNSVTFGSTGYPWSYGGNNNAGTSIIYHPIEDRYVVAAQVTSVFVGCTGASVSGTGSNASLTFGNRTNLNFGTTAYHYYINLVYDEFTNTVTLVASSGGGSVYTQMAELSNLTVSERTNSSYQNFSNGSTNNIKAVYDKKNKGILVYYQSSGTHYARFLNAASASATSYTFSSDLNILGYSNSPSGIALSYDETIEKVVAYTQKSSNNSNVSVVITNNSGTLSAATEQTVGTGAIFTADATYDTTNKRHVLVFRDNNNSAAGTANVVRQPYIDTNLEADNFIGIADGAYTNGQTATVQVVGSVDDAQSGLTPGKKYYVQADGSLSLTPDTPSVLAGVAVAATKLLIK